jgi:hypothetical protein
MAAVRPLSNAEREKAEAIVQSANPNEDSEFHVTSEVQAFNGRLIFVTWTSKGGQIYDNYIFLYKGTMHHFHNMKDAARYIDLTEKRRYRTNSALLDFLSVPAAIAILITITICYSEIIKVDIPQILSNSLATILGFYFGTKVVEGARSSDVTPD